MCWFYHNAEWLVPLGRNRPGRRVNRRFSAELNAASQCTTRQRDALTKLIRALRELVSELRRQIECFVFLEPMLGDELS